jgi:hypothetical protein
MAEDEIENEDEFMDSIIKFINAEAEAVEKGEHGFTCPLCGGRAFWVCSPYDGHRHSGCTNCKVSVME